MRWVVAGLLVATSIGTARGDSWSSPTAKTTASADSTWRLTVQPREPVAQLKEASAPAVSGQTATPRSAIGRMEHLENGQWQTVWSAPLTNPEAPVDVLVSNDGHVATLDNWGNYGWGDNVVTLYGTQGQLVRAFGLSDFLPVAYVHALPRSVGSIRWRGEAWIDERDMHLVVAVLVPTADRNSPGINGAPDYVDVRFDLVTGRQLPPTGPVWAEALLRAEAIHQALEKEEAIELAAFVAPLEAPVGNDHMAWLRYLARAYVRLESDGWSTTIAIELPDSSDFEATVDELRGALERSAQDASALSIVIGSPSQDVLLDVLSREAGRLPLAALDGRSVHVATTRRNEAAVRTALAHTGARLTIIDVDTPIPQQPERIERARKDSEKIKEGRGLVEAVMPGKAAGYE
ncbi:hypothetical protein [Dokdonella koreensis]|nr:hypothetical protein [Dokdonella koreensis]